MCWNFTKPSWEDPLAKKLSLKVAFKKSVSFFIRPPDITDTLSCISSVSFPLSLPHYGVYMETFPHLSALMANGQSHSLSPPFTCHTGSPQFIHTLFVSGDTFWTSVGSLYPPVLFSFFCFCSEASCWCLAFFWLLESSSYALGFISPPD